MNRDSADNRQKDTLRCSECGTAFERPGSRGPVPTRCAECKATRRRTRHAEEERRRQQRVTEGRYRCGRCAQEKDGADFARSQRRDGGWCKACFRETYVERSGGMQSRECPRCGATFEATKRSRQRYCSRSCKDEAGQQRRLDRKREAKRGRPCENCGKDIPVERHRNARYCSERCHRVHAGPINRYRARLKKEFGLTMEQYEGLIESQGGGCAICGATENASGRRLHVDHCHNGGGVRGVLCSNCNTGLGHFADDPARLRVAADYLERKGTPT